MNMNKNNYLILLVGALFGVLLTICGVVIKDTIVFRIQCDGIAVQTWNGDNYCINPTTMTASK